MTERFLTLTKIILTVVCLSPFLPSVAAQNIRFETHPQLDEAQPTETKQITDYTLPPDKLQKAHALYLTNNTLFFVGQFYRFGVLILLLLSRWAVRIRDWVEGALETRLAQAFWLVSALTITVSILLLPLAVCQHYFLVKYEISRVSWAGWSFSWIGNLFLGLIIPPFLIWILYGTIRRSPKFWGLYFWLAFAPITALWNYVYLDAIDPMLHVYKPLKDNDAAFVSLLVTMEHKAGIDIPTDHIFETRASQQVTGSNLFIVGFGSDARMIIWDTAIKRLTMPELLFLCAHEMGHYVLNHVLKMFLFTLAVFLVVFYLGYHLANWLLQNWGKKWEINDLGDLASLPLLWLVFSVVLFLSSPIINSYSRYQEHKADQYALQLAHDFIPDFSQVAAAAFQSLGEDWLEYPYVNQFFVIWMWNHPPVSERIQFAIHYHDFVQK
jgi:STE24 endopeptidase